MSSRRCAHRCLLTFAPWVITSVRLSECTDLGCSPSFSRFTGVHVRKDLHSASECILVAHNASPFFLTSMGLGFLFSLQGSNQHPQADHDLAAQCSLGHALRRRARWASARASGFDYCPFHLEDFTGECSSLCQAALWLSGPVRPNGGILSAARSGKSSSKFDCAWAFRAPFRCRHGAEPLSQSNGALRRFGSTTGSVSARHHR